MPLTTGMVVVFGLVGLLAVLFVTEAVPAEIAALAVLVLLAALEPWTQVTPSEAIGGFASPATVTVLAMFVLSEGVRRTGIVDRVGARVAAATGDDERRQVAATIGLSGPVAGVVNNTPVVAVLIPVVTSIAREGGTSPSKLLLPLSYASMLGGTLTLIGTSTNLVAGDLSGRLLEHPIGIVEFTPVGAAVLVVGAAYLLTVGRWLTPARVPAATDLVAKFRLGDHLGRLTVPADSPLVGEQVVSVAAAVDSPVDVVQIRGAGGPGESRRITGPFTDQPIEAGDVLTVRAAPATRRALAEAAGLELVDGGGGSRARNERDRSRPTGRASSDADERVSEADLVTENHTLVEVTVATDSRLVGETLESRSFRERYRATVLGAVRGDEVLDDDLAGTTLEAGDSLLVQTHRDDVAFLREVPGLVVTAEGGGADQVSDETWLRSFIGVEEVRDVIDAGQLRGLVDAAGLRVLLERAEAERGHGRAEKLPVAVGTLAAVVGLAALDVLDIYVLALGGVVVMVATGCVRTGEAYEAVDWGIIILLAGVIPLGVAMSRTGAAAYLGGGIAAVGTVLPPVAMLGVFYLFTAVLASVVTPAATVSVLIPVAIDAAGALGADPFSFLLATTFGASTAVLTPVGYQTNLMVYSPGGYAFTDYLRVGGPLQLLLTVVVTAAIAVQFGV